MPCQFCKSQDVKKRIVYRDKLVRVFPSHQPIVPGHLLLCPVRCVPKVDDLTDEEWGAVIDLLLRLKDALKKSLGAEGFNIAWNEGGMAGQSVDHLHIHVVPRKDGDLGIYEYEPRKFLYRPGTREESQEKELKAVAEMIKKNLE